MECYFGKQVQDLVVPKGYEQAKMMSSSPESGSQWGDSYPKKNFDSNMNMAHEEHNNGGSILWNDETVFQQFADEEHAMEWYFDNKVEDLVVPKGCDQSQSKMNSSSTESWSQWGMTPKKNFDSEMNMSHEELYNNGGSLLWNDEADFQQFAEEEARINDMEDDIFFSSLLEQDSTKDSAETHDNTTLRNNADVIEGKMVNSQYHGQSFGSSRYLKTHAFSPSTTDWANGEVSTTCQMQKYTSNENSMEESVLNDLERVTAQFTDKTRICFRDAFYRLAESSKQSLNSCQDGESMMASNDDTLRAGETEDSESETNVIDRAVASFIFHKFEFDGACSQQQTDYNEDAEGPGPGPIRGMQQELQQATAF